MEGHAGGGAQSHRQPIPPGSVFCGSQWGAGGLDLWAGTRLSNEIQPRKNWQNLKPKPVRPLPLPRGARPSASFQSRGKEQSLLRGQKKKRCAPSPKEKLRWFSRLEITRTPAVTLYGVLRSVWCGVFSAKKVILEKNKAENTGYVKSC